MGETKEGGGRALSPKEFAAQLGRTPKTVRSWLRQGYIRGSRAGSRGHWLIPRSEVARLRGEAGEE